MPVSMRGAVDSRGRLRERVARVMHSGPGRGMKTKLAEAGSKIVQVNRRRGPFNGWKLTRYAIFDQGNSPPISHASLLLPTES